MIGRVKRWLGIEGVKLELDVPDEIHSDRLIEGKLIFFSMHAQTVQLIRVRLIEKYKRGRGKHKLIDEYELGTIELSEDIPIPADELVEVDFALPFTLAQSDMDAFGEKNVVFRGIAGVAKFAKGVHSTYRLVAEAKVKGTALNPFDSKAIRIIAGT